MSLSLSKGKFTMTIKERIKILREKIADALEKAGRSNEEITVVGVTKGIDIERIIEGIKLGIHILGENRVQEAREKIPLINLPCQWHLIGHLQKNKVKYAVKLFDMIQSVDSIELAGLLNKKLNKKIDILIEVNTSGEPQKFGIAPEKLPALIDSILGMENLNLLGLMTVGPYPVEEYRSRKAFSLLRELRDNMERRFKVKLPILSMGMTEDFEYAILEGANMLRIGRGIYGERNYP